MNRIHSQRSTSSLPEPDRALLRRAVAGDERAFAKIVSQYEDLVYSFASKVCRDREKAEETWQDTFVSVYRKLHQFDGRSKFSTWLYSIVANACLMKRRRRKLDDLMIHYDDPHAVHAGRGHRAGPEAEQCVAAWNATPHDIVEDSELRVLLDRSIERLPMDYRMAFILRDVEGRSAEETAKILKLSVPAVKSRLRRARVFLREQLNEYMTS